MQKRGRPPHPEVLTPREFEVLALLRERLTNEQIADRLGVTAATAKYHVSEIITKLGVATRHEAALWQPEPDSPATGPPRRAWALAFPTALLRRLHVLTPIAGGGIVLAAAAAVALLAWGVVSARSNGVTRWSTTGSAGDHPSVVVFDLPKKTIERLPVSVNAGNAAWLKDGEKFVAQGSDASDYGIFDISGQKIGSPLTQGLLTRGVIPVPDGESLLVGRTDDQYIVSAPPVGSGRGFLDSARELQFSPDGARVAYISLSHRDQDGNLRDARTVIVGERSSLSGYGGGGVAVQQAFEDETPLDLAPHAWSSDSSKLLVLSSMVCPPNGNAPCQGSETFTVYGLAAKTGDVVWRHYDGRLGNVQWAGPGQLFVQFKREAERDSDFPDASALIVDLGLAKRPAPGILAEDFCCASFSPDGRYAVVRHGTGLAWKQRCSLVDTTSGTEVAGFDGGSSDVGASICESVSWTRDGTKALVTHGGGF